MPLDFQPDTAVQPAGTSAKLTSQFDFSQKGRQAQFDFQPTLQVNLLSNPSN
jgi:hypothetical protein